MPLSASERRAVAAAAAAVSLLIAQQVAARAVRDTLFLGAFRVRSLPFVMMAAALAALLGARALSAALARRPPARVVALGASLSAAVLVVLFALSIVWPRPAAVVLYLHVAAFGGALVSGFWSLVNERFDPYTARRVVGRIGTGAAAGGVAGGLLTWLLAGLVPVSFAILLLAALHGAAALLVHRSFRPASGAGGRVEAPLPTASLVNAPFLRQISVLVLLGALVETIVDFTFKAESQARFGTGGTLLAAFSLFHAGMSVASLLLQATAARGALEHLGIAGTAALRPLLTAGGALAGALWPGFGTALAARGAHESLTNSLFRSAYELLYTPMPEAEKRRAKALIDVGVDKVGALAGSALLAGVMALAPGAGTRPLFAAAAALSLVALAFSRALHRGYVHTLERSLLDGRVRLDAADVVDPATRLTLAHTGLMDRSSLLREIEALRSSPSLDLRVLAEPVDPGTRPPAPAPRSEDPLVAAVADLRSGEPARVRAALRRHAEPPPLLVAATIPLLADDECFPDVLRALRRAASETTGQLVDALLDRGAEPTVRRRVARVLRGCASPRAVAGLRAALEEPSFDVRAAAGAALAALHESSSLVEMDRDDVLDRVRRELDSGEPVDRQLPQLFALLSLILDAKPLQLAWAAMKTDDRVLRGTALEYLDNVLPDDVFARLRSCFGASIAWAPGPRRPVAAVADELRASSVGVKLGETPWSEPES
jgi:AAA family ATP:ADP antiporter